MQWVGTVVEFQSRLEFLTSLSQVNILGMRPKVILSQLEVQKNSSNYQKIQYFKELKFPESSINWVYLGFTLFDFPHIDFGGKSTHLSTD